ncbi:MAG: hypothetical protein FJW14_03325 [Acidimicrobiia bacterium]|nr:hypothetical protein [Acidimicrobiia bacterium]
MSVHYDTIIVGAGQAGLAAGYFLSRVRSRFLLLDNSSEIGDSWRRRWDSLRLFTPNRYNALPGMPFPGNPAALPTKDDVAAYLQSYAARFDLPVRLSASVSAVEHHRGAFIVRTADDELAASSVIIATGAYGRPSVPLFASELAPRIVGLHSSNYRNPRQLPDGDVLVVGAGNSGAQIALELSASRRVWLSGPSTGAIPRRVLGRDVYDWLWPTLMRPSVDSWIGRRLTAGRLFAGDPLVGMTMRDLERPALTRVGRMTGVRVGRPVVEGREDPLDVAAVIWCTGFRPDFGWIQAPVVRPDGYPLHLRGVVSSAPGLAFVGLRYQSRLNSSLLGGVGEDAAFVVSALQDRQRGAA